jgi:hypothetical protein
MPPDAAAPAPGAPAAAPNPLGLKAAAAQEITTARKILEASLVIFGSESEEGKALVKAISSLGSIFPGEAGSLPSETPGPASAPMTGPKPGPQMGF